MAKRGRGRPAIPEEDRLKSVSVGFSENDRKLIDPMAESIGENFGEFVRTATLDRVANLTKAKPAAKKAAKAKPAKKSTKSRS